MTEGSGYLVITAKREGFEIDIIQARCPNHPLITITIISYDKIKKLSVLLCYSAYMHSCSADNVPVIRRQTRSSAWYANQHTICHKRFTTGETLPGSEPWHHVRLWLPWDVQTGAVIQLKLNQFSLWLFDMFCWIDVISLLFFRLSGFV